MAYTIASPFGANVAGDLEPWMTDHLGWLVDALGSMFDPTWSIVSERGSDGDAGYVPGFGSLFDIDLCPSGALGYLGQFVGVAIPDGAPDAVARGLVRTPTGLMRGTPASFVGIANAYLTGTPLTGTLTAGSQTVTAVSSFTNLTRNTTTITGAGVPGGATITALNSGAATFTLSEAATASGSIALLAKTVFIDERFGGDAYQLYVATYLSETKNSATATYALADGVYSTYAAAVAAATTYSAVQGNGAADMLAALVTVKPAGIILTYEAITGGDYRSARDSHQTYTIANAAYGTYSAGRANPTQQ